MRTETLGPDVVRVQGEVYDSAATVHLRGREAVIVDALGSRADARELRRFLDEDLGVRVAFILATHYFSDHLAALALFPEAQIVAHQAHAHTFDEERYRTEEERGFYVPPTIVVRDGLRLRFGRFTFDVFHNPGHTTGTLNVEVPEADLLHVGDTVVGRIVYLNYSSPPLMREALFRLRSRRAGRLLAGHGPAVDPVVHDHALFYLDALGRAIHRAWSEDRPEETIAAIPLSACLRPGLTATPFEELYHGRNLRAAVDRRLFTREGD